MTIKENNTISSNTTSTQVRPSISQRFRRRAGAFYHRLRLLRSFLFDADEMAPYRLQIIKAVLNTKVNIQTPHVRLAETLLTFDANYLEPARIELTQKALDQRTNLDDALKSVEYARHSAQHPDESRYSYQKHIMRYRVMPGDQVLDIGSGGDPFPYATILADRYLQPTHHRSSDFQTLGKPVVVCDIQQLPFPDQRFDYVICAHVLEHVKDPISACRELQRVGKAGFIETPTLMKDALFSWAKGMHKWHLVAMRDHLFFFEYDERRAEGIRSLVWHDLILVQPSYHPFQEIFNANQDIFNTVLEWQTHFQVTVAHLDGTVHTLP